MGKRVAETERKYEAAEQTGEPDLEGLPGVAAVRVLEPAELDAVYVDTSDLRLATHRITLRRRTGGDDAGWHLKLPSSQADTRTEVHAPLGKQGRKGGPRVPKPLLAEVAAIVRDRELVPVVRLRNTRKRVHLVDDAGAPLVEIAHDHVRATVLDHGDGAESAWTEVETELLDGDTALLDALEKRFRAAGLRRSKSPSKLARALGDRLATAPGRRSRRPRPAPRGTSSCPTCTSRSPRSSAGTRRSAATSRTPSTRCGSPPAGCAAPSSPSAANWTAG